MEAPLPRLWEHESPLAPAVGQGCEHITLQQVSCALTKSSGPDGRQLLAEPAAWTTAAGAHGAWQCAEPAVAGRSEAQRGTSSAMVCTTAVPRNQRLHG
jgi:hypothetical protein